MTDHPGGFRRIKLNHSEDFFIRKVLKETKLKEIMNAPPVFAYVEDQVHTVIKKMNDRRIRHIPVVSKAGELLGVITQGDLFKYCPPHKNEDGVWYYDPAEVDNLILKHIMTPEPFALTPEDTIDKAVLAMAQHKYGCVPIVDEHKRLCGIITQMDIILMAASIVSE